MSSFTNDNFNSIWSDVEPVPQDDGPNPVISIQYTAEFTKLMDLFRAVLRSGEKSNRVLQLTSDLLAINAANYTLWKYRRDCLKAMNSCLRMELDYMDRFAQDNPKNYQIWYHRRAIAEMLSDASREVVFCNKVFEVDPKNYHAWAHRQWVVLTYNLFDGELDYTTSLIQSDKYNNSAWNHRWFVLHARPYLPPSAELLEQELAYTWSQIEASPHNESAWNYLRGLCKHHFFLKPTVIEMCNCMKASVESNDAKAIYPFLWSLMVDLFEESCTIESLTKAASMIAQLAEGDSIRVKYWNRHLNIVSAKIDASEASLAC
jgi:protein farnesyltransferase/geranylgeranyltransferase type-1 subunit alpha